MNKKINTIVEEETLRFINELIDPNAGSTYYPPGLNPKVVKLFEDIDSFYQATLDDDYWKDVSKKFPGYNGPQDGGNPVTHKAVDYIIAAMKKKYPDQNWDEIEHLMRNKIKGGLTE